MAEIDRVIKTHGGWPGAFQSSAGEASVLRPEQGNRALTALEEKFYRDRAGDKQGMGLKVFP